ncbi:MAG: SDR family oxidoreductase, partial [Anaerolineae bacterium]
MLITGGSGYLGRHLCRIAAKNHTVHTTFFSHADSVSAGQAHPLNITDPIAVRSLMARLRPEAVIHCAAANPGSDERRMMAVNRDGAANIAASAAEYRARLVHVSTDMVHDGRHAPYLPTAQPTPINPYGKSKAAAEAAVIVANPAAAIVRTSLIFGLDEMDRGTAGFAQRLQAGDPLTLFEDHIRQPVWVQTLADALLKLAVNRPTIAGVLNVAGGQALSRAEVGER